MACPGSEERLSPAILRSYSIPRLCQRGFDAVTGVGFERVGAGQGELADNRSSSVASELFGTFGEFTGSYNLLGV